MADLYSTAELMALVDFTEAQPFYMLERAFIDSAFSKADEIVFDDIFDDVVIAPFSAPVVNGKPVVHEGSKTRSFRPAYIKLSDPITIAQISRRTPGQPINVPANRPAQLQAARVKRLGQHRRSVLTRLEWMAWQYALYGSYTVSGESYPTKFLGFQRAAGNTVTLSGPALWSAPTTAKPVTDWGNWSQQMLTSCGLTGALLTMSPEAWSAGSQTDQFKEEYKNFKSNGGPVPNTSPALAKRVAYKGQYGEFEIEVVNTDYLDENKVRQRYLPANKVILSAMGADALGGVRAFGKIEHMAAVEAGDPMVDIFHYEWKTPDGSAHHMSAESAPLIAAKRPNAFLAATVL
jgi:hypothetical protein